MIRAAARHSRGTGIEKDPGKYFALFSLTFLAPTFLFRLVGVQGGVIDHAGTRGLKISLPFRVGLLRRLLGRGHSATWDARVSTAADCFTSSP